MPKAISGTKRKKTTAKYTGPLVNSKPFVGSLMCSGTAYLAGVAEARRSHPGPTPVETATMVVNGQSEAEG